METALAALSSANERLTQLNVEKNEFLGIAAHDLKNPLATVKGLAQFLHWRISTGRTTEPQPISLEPAGWLLHCGPRASK